MFVFLGPFFVGNGHALTCKLTPAHFSDTGDDISNRLIGVLGDELGAVVVCARRPGVYHLLHVSEQEVGCQGEIGLTAVGIVVDRVVLYRPVARSIGVEVLAPEQKLYGVPSGGDIFFTTFFVERNQ